jgi:hypothetical protein
MGMTALMGARKSAGFGDSSLDNKDIHRTRNHSGHTRWRFLWVIVGGVASW